MADLKGLSDGDASRWGRGGEQPWACIVIPEDDRVLVKGGEKTYQRGGAKPYH